ncbi:MAG: hypothetical protein FJX29_12535 [Alphaproteobacteria bacterium]|nr:hypothetical protein [Alphaproteobacteria bacterium]
MSKRSGGISAVRMAALAASLALAGCAGGGADPGDTIGNIFAFNSTRAPPVEAPAQDPGVFRLICPVVDVRDGGAAHRVYHGSGRTSSDVRYQFSVGETARECTRQGGQIVIRVGVEGKVLLGPAGGPSTFSVPVFIGVRRDRDQQMVVSKVYNVQANIASGSVQTSFSVVSEPLSVPYMNDNANLDYSIYVGFERPQQQPQRTSQRRRR